MIDNNDLSDSMIEESIEEERRRRAEKDAPLGTDATAFIPDSRVNSTSTVGLPLESNISLAYIFFILLIFSLHINYKIL